MSTPQTEVRLPGLRLYPDQDADLIAWMGTLARLPHGAKGQALKDTLRRGLGLRAQSPATLVTSHATPVRVERALDAEELLGDIRRVVEAALEEALTRYAVQGTQGGKVRESEVADEVEAILGRLGASLMLLDEEEI